MWRVEINLDGRYYTLVPIITECAMDAERVFYSFCSTLCVPGVIRLYAPGRLLQDNYRVQENFVDENVQEQGERVAG